MTKLLPPVRWGASANFLNGLWKTFLYDAFPDRLDPRDWMLPAPCDERLAADGTLWFDYFADTGDSGRAFATLAMLLQQDLDVAPDGAVAAAGTGGERLPRGQFLVVGGDTAYTVADERSVNERFILPWELAARHTGLADPKHPRRRVYAIPGNHDWYDSLDGFNRVFRRGPGGDGPKLALAGYEPVQDASYFAIRIFAPGADAPCWTIHGLDVTRDDMDYRQARFFAAEPVAKGHVLVVPTPARAHDRDAAWYREGGFGQPEGSRYRVGSPKEARLVLSGDVHHYARYPGRYPNDTLVQCGLGGASLHPTHVHRRPEPSGGERARIDEARFVPDRAESARRFHWRKTLFGLRGHWAGLCVGAILGLGPLPALITGDAGAVRDLLVRLGVVFATIALLVGWFSGLKRFGWFGQEREARKQSLPRRLILTLGVPAVVVLAALWVAGEASVDPNQIVIELLWHLLALGIVVGMAVFAGVAGGDGSSAWLRWALGLATGAAMVLVALAAGYAGTLVAPKQIIGYVAAAAAAGVASMLAWPLLFAGLLGIVVRLGGFATLAGSLARDDGMVAFLRCRVQNDRLDAWLIVGETDAAGQPWTKPIAARVRDRFSVTAQASAAATSS